MGRRLPPIDVHSHVSSTASPLDLERLGAVVFAATRSLDEYEAVKGRNDPVIIWGVGCHPGVIASQEKYNEVKFEALIKSTSFVSEVGLDGRSKIPIEVQERVFNSILHIVQRSPRIVSIHSSGAVEQVLDALSRVPVKGAVLHWWRGNTSQTQRAIDLGCYFSVNWAGMKHKDHISLIPLERILTETDHPYGDRGASDPRQPGSVVDTEKKLADLTHREPGEIRNQIWLNFATLVHAATVQHLLPGPVQRMIDYVRRSPSFKK